MGKIIPLLMYLKLSSAENGIVESPTIDMFQLDAVGLIGNNFIK